MRVLYLTANAPGASTLVSTEAWIRALRPRGLRPVLVSHRSAAFDGWSAEHRVPAYRVPLPGPSKSRPWGFLRSLRTLRTLVKRHRIQLIHCNEHDIYPIGQYLGRLCRLPCVVSVHFRISPGFADWAFRGGRRPRRIYFVSLASLESCRASVEGLVPEADWRVLPNALDLEQYRPEAAVRDRARDEYGLKGDLAIGAACTLRPIKQLEHLIEAVARLSPRPARLLLAGGRGTGDEAYADAVLELGERKLGDRFRYLGYLDDPRGFMQALDLYVNTSREETCSISILEALACGCPVVGYPSLSVSEQVLPGGGEIVAQDQIDELAAALDRWLSDPARLAAGRVGARRRAEGYDIAAAADRLWAEYQSMLG
jgi:glycosyltransferase involved in cell wall biosynthesis